MAETLAQRKSRLSRIIAILDGLYPRAATELRFKSLFQLLVAVILSAQSTDKQVNRITPALFRRYRSVRAFAEAPLAELESAVSSINYFRSKASYISRCAKLIIERHGSRVPDTMQELTALPGIARKSANIILYGHGRIDGIAVDTHVMRLSGRLGLSSHDAPVKIEQDLMRSAPRERWADLSNMLILHGRRVCPARGPRCGQCTLCELCPSCETPE